MPQTCWTMSARGRHQPALIRQLHPGSQAPDPVASIIVIIIMSKAWLSSFANSLLSPPGYPLRFLCTESTEGGCSAFVLRLTLSLFIIDGERVGTRRCAKLVSGLSFPLS